MYTNIVERNFVSYAIPCKKQTKSNEENVASTLLHYFNMDYKKDELCFLTAVRRKGTSRINAIDTPTFTCFLRF